MRRMDKLRNIAHLQDLIKFYFMLGLRYGDIPLLLCMVDDTAISRLIHTPRRICRLCR